MGKNIKKKTKGSVEFVGEISSFVHRQDNKWLQKWNAFLRFMENVGLISRKFLYKYYAKGRLVRADKDFNVITNAGLTVLAEILAEEYVATGSINKMALGNGVGTPNVTDTALFNEVYRNATASFTSSTGVAICTAFFTETEVDGTFTEFGNFIDDTEMWSHINAAWVKTAFESLTVQCKYTLANKP